MDSKKNHIEYCSLEQMKKKKLGEAIALTEDMAKIDQVNAELFPGKRQEWNRQIQFLLACVGYSVGLGNVWRFGYLCSESGGGAFLIPYFITLFVVAVPLMYMEFCVGQFTRRGPTGALRKLCPFFKGTGMATVIISFWLTTYYIVIIAWDLYYIFASLNKEVPWKTCNNTWNSEFCWDGRLNATFKAYNDTKTPSEEYFKRKILDESSGFNDFGVPKWDLTLIVILAWIIIYFCIFRGVKSTGKVVYVTATFPYVVIIIMLIRGVTLDGASTGLKYFFQPKWSDLLKPKVWANAAIQNFNSIGVAFGGLISMASYKRKTDRILRDVVCISLIDCFTSIVCGSTVFSVLGYIAKLQGKEMNEVVGQGPGLVFMVIPEAIRNMDIAPFWSILFFSMIFLLGIDSQFTMVDTVVTTIEDEWGSKLIKYYKRREILVFCICFGTFLLTLPVVCPGGIFYFTLLDHFSAGISVFYIAFFEIIAIVWIYGAERLAQNIHRMTGEKPHFLFILCWKFFAPILILIIWSLNWYLYEPVKYGKYEYPVAGQILGWSTAMVSLCAIPFAAVHELFKAKGNGFIQKFKNSFKPQIDDIEDSKQSLENIECVPNSTYIF